MNIPEFGNHPYEEAQKNKKKQETKKKIDKDRIKREVIDFVLTALLAGAFSAIFIAALLGG